MIVSLRAHILVCVSFVSCYFFPIAAELIKVESEQQFQDVVLNSAKPVVAQFAASWCGACQVAKPKFEETSHEASLKDKVMFVYVDVEKVPVIAERYEILGIPTFIFFNNGVEKGRNSGYNNALGTKMKEGISDHFGIVMDKAVRPAQRPTSVLCSIKEGLLPVISSSMFCV